MLIPGKGSFAYVCPCGHWMRELIESFDNAVLSWSHQSTRWDLSSNVLEGRLPPSMGDLAAFKILYLQDNKLIGTLDVIEDPTDRRREFTSWESIS
ncbi:unnamed protein product [Eruca vesicaria subsp. sativa]|uniref:Uncharacterized protein n=1 Tax=Eruca vesicaria subsp. sativa TaxID=29727 RepID=A0ABC8M820_ERUVS|nr:unnamed protein product [Eruca vesicaria subsp. sativa]